jgi:hypothetical protein
LSLFKQGEASLRKEYGAGAFAQGCLLARRLVEHGGRVVEVGINGWDTHTNNFTNMPELCRQLDQGLATLLSDLSNRGMLRETLVVVATEFGRTPQINVNQGRDHYPQAFSAAMFGGGIKDGFVLGATDPTGTEIIDKKVSVPDPNATIAHALGLHLEEKVQSPSGRPFSVADKGKAILELFASAFDASRNNSETNLLCPIEHRIYRRTYIRAASRVLLRVFNRSSVPVGPRKMTKSELRQYTRRVWVYAELKDMEWLMVQLQAERRWKTLCESLHL